MKKKFRWINKNKSIIFSIALIVAFFALFMQANNIYAASNPEYASNSNAFTDYLKNLMSAALNASSGALTKPIAAIVNVVNVVLFLILYTVFVTSGVTNGIAFPFPDQIIFNGIPMLDPNFINPTTSDKFAIVKIVNTLVQRMYYSFFTLAATVFVLSAIIIGIKLAFSSIAGEKAQYKEAIKQWVIGLATLFLLHFLLAGMFAINERVCWAASVKCSSVEIKVSALDFVPVVGQIISNVVNVVGALFGQPNGSIKLAEISLKGYGGIIIEFIAKGILQNDLVYSIGLSIMLGQTFTLVIMYFKRVFYCILLGMLAPLIVAVDTIQKVLTGKDTGIFKNWLQNMVAIIFTQSFQAIFLCVTVLIIGEMSSLNAPDMIEAVVAVVALNAIMKFDKLFKEMLGIKDSKIMGGFKDNAMKSFAAIKSGMDLAKRSAEPFKQRAAARTRLNEARSKRSKAMSKLSALDGGGDSTSSTTSESTPSMAQTLAAETASKEISKENKGESAAKKDEKASSSNQQIIAALNKLNDTLSATNQNSTKLASALESSAKASKSDSDDKKAEKREKLMDEISNYDSEIEKSKADMRAQSLKAFTRFGTSVGSVGFGYGATGNLENAITVGNIVDKPMDAMTDRAVDRGVYSSSSTRVSNSKQAFVEKYKNAGLSDESANKLADQSMKSAAAALESQIPESIGNMATSIVSESLQGVADTAKSYGKSGRSANKDVQKRLYSSKNIDEI